MDLQNQVSPSALYKSPKYKNVTARVGSLDAYATPARKRGKDYLKHGGDLIARNLNQSMDYSSSGNRNSEVKSRNTTQRIKSGIRTYGYDHGS